MTTVIKMKTETEYKKYEIKLLYNVIMLLGN